jgi:hypothetical protein
MHTESYAAYRAQRSTTSGAGPATLGGRSRWHRRSACPGRKVCVVSESGPNRAEPAIYYCLYRLTKTPRGPIYLASRRFRSRGRGIRCRLGCRNGLRIILHGGRYPSQSIIYWEYRLTKTKPHVVRYTSRHGDSARVDGISVVNGAVGMDCEISYMDVDATRSHRSR